jgi:hypothetical protein
VASEVGRPVGELERRFFNETLGSLASNVPAVLVFTKYNEFVGQVQLDWSHDAQAYGQSKVAVSHILRDLSSEKFEKQIGRKWADALGDNNGSILPRVCVSEDDGISFLALAETTLAGLRQRCVRFAFAAAQRNSASISTQCESQFTSPEFTTNFRVTAP